MKEYNVNDGDGARPPLNDLAAFAPENVLEAAALYTAMGIYTVPNETGKKKPAIKAWTKARLRQEDLPAHFGDDQNLGLLLGEPSGWLVCVDLDAPEALGIADLFLEPTLSGGREGTPLAHRYYWVPGAKTKKFQDAGGVILEVRSTGCQMLVEPSEHPNGERYAWHRDGGLEPVEISPRELEQRCAELAAAVAVARRLPQGGRHEYAQAVVGFLLRRLNEEAVLRIVLAAWRAGEADGPDAVGDLKRIVGDSARRLAEGENAFGGPKLGEMAPGLPDLLGRFLDRRSPEQEGANGAAAGTDKRVPTHDELRDRWLAAAHSPTAHGQGEWRRYAEGFWAPVNDQVVYGEVDRVLEAAKPEKVRPTAGMRASVEKMARAKAYVPDEAWDANDGILVCANGTLEISEGVLREHRPEDYALAPSPTTTTRRPRPLPGDAS